VAVALNIGLFFKPITKPTKAATWKPVAYLDRHVQDVIDGLRQVEASAGTPVVVFKEDTTGWRNVAYYQPELSVFVCSKGANPERPVVWVIRNGRSEARELGDPTMTLPPTNAVAVWAADLGKRSEEFARIGRWAVLPARENQGVEIFNINFRTGAGPPEATERPAVIARQ
jgi:hypothetical protein